MTTDGGLTAKGGLKRWTRNDQWTRGEPAQSTPSPPRVHRSRSASPPEWNGSGQAPSESTHPPLYGGGLKNGGLDHLPWTPAKVQAPTCCVLCGWMTNMAQHVDRCADYWEAST